MKVLVVGTGGSIVSGISTAADQMARTLTGYGYEVDRLTAGERRRRRSNTLNVENVTAVLTDARTVYHRARRDRADIVWIHTFGVPTLACLRALALVAAARLARRPAFVHLHAFALERFVADGGPALRLVLRALTAWADAVVVLHQPAADALGGLSRRRVHVVENWVDPADPPAPLPLEPPFRLVFVGGLIRRKGAPQLVEAMRELGDLPVELRMVGGAGEDGPGALARLQGAAADLVAAGRVTFVGERDGAGVRAELRAAHLFVLPSEAEGTPMAMLEAMAEGRPVLVSDAGDMRAIVESTGCGWVLPDLRPASIAAAVRQIAGDPHPLGAAAVAAEKACRVSYSPDARRDQIDAILRISTRRRRWSITTA